MEFKHDLSFLEDQLKPEQIEAALERESTRLIIEKLMGLREEQKDTTVRAALEYAAAAVVDHENASRIIVELTARNTQLEKDIAEMKSGRTYE